MNYQSAIKNVAVTTVLAAGLLTATTAKADAEVTFVDVPNTFTGETLENAKLFIPDGPGPFPAVVVMHGSGGLWKDDNPNGGIMTTHFEEWGTRLQLAGYVSIFIDSYTPRGIVEFHSHRPAEDPAVDDVLASNRHVRPTDAHSALAWLRDQSYIKDGYVALMGFSQGAESVLVSVTDETITAMQNDWTVRYLELDNDVINLPVDAPYTVPDGTGFRTAVAYYPGCGFYNYFGQSSVASAARYMPDSPTFVLHGTNDSLYSGDLYPLVLRDKSDLHAQLINAPDTTFPWDDGMGGNVTDQNPFWHQTYPGVGHSFDELDAQDGGYDQKLIAIDEVMTWLDFYLKSDGVIESTVGDWLDYEPMPQPTPSLILKKKTRATFRR